MTTIYDIVCVIKMFASILRQFFYEPLFFSSSHISLDNLEADYLELKQKLDQMQSLAISLQVQLSSAQGDLSDLRAEKEKLISERDVERQALQDALDAAIIERAENDAKWQRDFEQLRTLNSG